MKTETKILLEEYREEFKSYKNYIDKNNWFDDIKEDKSGNMYSNKLNTELSMVSTILKTMKKFTEDVGDDGHLKEIKKFIDDTVSIVKKHVLRIDKYKKMFPFDDSTSDKEMKFQTELWGKKIYTKLELSKLNIDEKEESRKSLELFHGKTKAPLLMREYLCDTLPIIEQKTNQLVMDFSAPIINPATSNEMLINMKTKDIPKWDVSKHFFEQDLSTIQFWEEEIRKIKNGVNIGGYFIHPWLYWHLNMFMLAYGSGADKKPKNPRFRDNEYFFTEMLTRAEKHGKCGLLMYGSRRISKELADYEEIITTEGLKRIGDIKEGDIVYGRDGKKTKVLGVANNGLKPIYRMTLMDGRTVDCGLEHQWLVIENNRKDSQKVLTTQDLLDNGISYLHKRSGSNYKYSLPLNEPVQYEGNTHLPIPPYMLGILLGDGSLTNGGISFASKDDEIVEYIQELLGSDYSITNKKGEVDILGYNISRYVKYNGNNKYIVDKYGHNPIHRAIKELKLDVKYDNKFIPEIYKKSSVEDRFELLRGLLDSDGSCSKNGNIEFTVKNDILSKDTLDLARSLGLYASIIKEDKGMVKKTFPNGKTYDIHDLKYRVRIRTNQSVFKLKRKLERLEGKKDTRKVSIKSLEYIGDFTASCIGVDNEDKLYLTKDYIVTHNSVVMTSYLQKVLYTVRNAKCTVLGFSAIPDLKAIVDYMNESITNMNPALRINANNLDLNAGITLGLKRTAQERLDYTDLTFVNLESGSKKGAQKPAASTPDAFLFDEIGKGECIKPWDAAKPSFADSTDSSKWRVTPLLSGCVCAGTKVYNHKGMMVNIEDLTQNEGILGFDKKSQEVTKEPITWMQPSSEKECYRITTRKKHILECSYEHPILIRHRNKEERVGGKRIRKLEFVPTEDLKVGQQIVIAESVDIWGDKKMWEPRLVGWFIGDGTYGNNEVPTISSCDYEINDYISSNFETSDKKKPEVTKDGKDFLQRHLKGTGKNLRELGIFGQTKCGKTLPNEIYSYNKEDIVEMIGGLYDSDGHVSLKGTCPSIGFTSACENLIIEIKYLLNKLGIHPTYNKVKYKANELVKKDTEAYVLTISDKRSVDTFIKEITFKIKYKQDNLIKLSKYYENKKEQIPRELKNCRLDTISSIEYIGIKPIYNLTAGNTNTYLANGIVTHNTAGESELSSDAEAILKNPATYDIMPMDWDLLEDKIDPEYITWNRQNFAYFVPAQLSIEAPNKISMPFAKFLEDDDLLESCKIDIDVTDWKTSKEYFEKRRNDVSKDIDILARLTNSFPMDVEDCYLTSEVNKFPGMLAKRRKQIVLDNGLEGQKVWLIKNGDRIEAQQTKDKTISEYPYKGGNIDAPIVMLDDPQAEYAGKPPLGLYCIGFDDVKQDRSDGDSVMSATVFKRSYEGGEWSNRIVAYYDSRPARKRDYYRNLYLLIKYYNARILHENEDNGFVEYMEDNHIEDIYMHLSDGVGLATEENLNRNKNRKFGWAPTGLNIYNLEQTLVMYTKEEGIIIGYEEDLTGVDRINHPMLLEELYKYKKDKNADRIRSFGLALKLARYYDKTNAYMKHRIQYTDEEQEYTRRKNLKKTVKGFTHTNKLTKF